MVRNIVKSKYVIFEYDGEEAVVVFSPFIQHLEMAGDYKIKSAGFCELNVDGRWMVSGASESLECRSKPQDVEILNHHLLSKRPVHVVHQ